MKTTILSAAAFLITHIPVFAADSTVITHIDQRPWIINADGALKSETELTIESQTVDSDSSCAQAERRWLCPGHSAKLRFHPNSA